MTIQLASVPPLPLPFAANFAPFQPYPLIQMQPSDLSSTFRTYTRFSPEVDVWCVTPGEGRMIQRFYDTSPLSPGGCHLAVTRFPAEDRTPEPGEPAEIFLVDLHSGQQTLLAETRGWDTQLGAQLQWGASDHDLFFNDMDTRTWRPHGVRLDPFSGQRRELNGCVYNVSPDGKWAVSPCLRRSARTQLGYGVIVPLSQVPRNRGAADDDGITLTNTETGESRLLVSLRALVEQISEFQDPIYRHGDFYGFHTKWSPDGSRIMLILRWTPHSELAGLPIWRRFRPSSKPASKRTMLKNVVTLNRDGTGAKIAVHDVLWSQGGHHPNWCPDSRHIVMNLNWQEKGLRFVRVAYDGTGLVPLHETALGSGHPSIHPSGRFLLSDAYPKEPAAYGDGSVPIRLIDLESGRERRIVRIHCRPDYLGKRKEMRIDAHPAWSRDGNWITFNGCADGTRRVFLAWVGDLLKDF